MIRFRILAMTADPDLARDLPALLEPLGDEVVVAATPADVPAALAGAPLDLTLLDAQHAAHGGFAALTELRALGFDGPVIMLSEPRAVSHLTRAFERGVDDYLVKPFAPEELAARVAAVMRRHARATPAGAAAVVTAGDAQLDLATRVYRSTAVAAVTLTPLEALVLSHLMRQAGTSVPRATLSAAAWDPALYGDANRLDAYIARLRRKIEPTPTWPRYLLATPDDGLMFQPADSERARGRAAESCCHNA